MNYIRLGDILNVQNGYAFDSEFFSDSEGIPLIRIRDLRDGRETETKFKGEFDPAYIVNSGDYLIGMDGEFRCYEWKGEPALLNQRVCRLIDFNKSLFPKYLFFGINQHLEKIERNTAFVTVKHISSKQIKEIRFPVPPIQDQIHIANILAKATTLIEQRKESLRLLDEFLKSAFLEMFWIENRIEGKEYLINDLKSGGNKSFSNGPFGSDLLTTELKTQGVPVIYIRDIRNGIYLWKSDVYVTVDKAAALPNCHVQGNDVLIAKVGDPPGISAVYPNNLGLAIITQDVIRLRLNNEVALPKYFSYYLNSDVGKQLIKRISIEGTRNRFPLGDFKKLKVRIPELHNQFRFVSLVEKVEILKLQYQLSLRELENLHGSLGQKAFTGELKLHEA